MKKGLITAISIFAASMAGVYAGTPISVQQLPKAASDFIAQYFAGDNVRKVEQDQGRHCTEYEVDLTSGAEVDFREDGTWKEVKAARGNAVPSAIVPSAIAKYVATNYPGQSIVEISHKRGGYEIELTNGTELKLTADVKPLTGNDRGQRASLTVH